MIPTQKIAAEILLIVEQEGVSAKEVLNKLTKGYDYKVRGSVHAYVFETLKRLNTIDFILSKCLHKNLNEIDPFVKNILRIGLYEMKYKGVHPALATDSAVRIARERGRKTANLVNAVLRRAERFEIDYSKLDKIKKLSLQFSHPEWFVEYIIDLVGYKEAIKLLEANLKPQSNYVRVNELKTSIENVVRYLEQNKVELEETFLEEVFKVISYEKHPASLDLHAKGYYVIQDLASCFVSHVLKPEPGDKILDLAAAPGVKTSHMAMLMQNEGKIIAVDNSENRLVRMKHKLRTLGVKNVECILGDGCKISFNADKALVDAPCSSTGAFRLHPNVKWTFDERKFRATIKVQRKMIKNALKNANTIVYSTCSIMFEEDEENVSDLASIKLEKIKSPFSRGIPEFRGREFKDWQKVVRCYPHLHDCSGFFIAKLIKS